MANQTPLRILIVDDDRTVLLVLSALLGGDGHIVRSAETGAAALEAAALWRPDVLILDYDLPDHNGLEVLRQVRRMRAGETMKVILLSGYFSHPFRDELLAGGADAVGTKPVSGATLRRLLSEAVPPVPSAAATGGQHG